MTEKANNGDLLNLTRTRGRIDRLEGEKYWRSLEELANTEEFQHFLHREFPENASEWIDPVGRRNFLKLMGASLALAGLGACVKQPVEKIVPYVKQPEEIVPGRPLFFATAMPQRGVGHGVLVESHLGRPTKIEGNPEHPSSLGGTNVFSQASILGLYDPDRSQVVRKAGKISTWDFFLVDLNSLLESLKSRAGRGLRILTQTVTSPSLGAAVGELLTQFPEARWHQWEPVGRHSAREGSRIAFGEVVEPVYDFSQAEVVLSLDSDFLNSGPGSVRYARDFAAKRRVRGGSGRMSRLYAVEPTPSVTGAKADHRLPMRAGEVESLAREVGRKLGLTGLAGTYSEHADWIEALTKDLTAHRGTGLVVAGEGQPASVHALAHGLNAALGNAGRTVRYISALEVEPVDPFQSVGQLCEDMRAGQVDLLVMLGGNPVYDAPADLDFKGALDQVKTRVHLSLHEDETSELCHWHIPEAHYLESWGDVRGHDGTVSILQPLVAPLYGGRTAHELVSALQGKPGTPSHDLVKNYWKGQSGASDFEKFWRRSLHDGLVAGSALPERSVAVRADWSNLAAATPADGLEIVFRPDPCLDDGRFANNGWLQELPRPITKLTWDNAVLVAPATAERLHLENGALARLTVQGRTVEGPVWIQPGQAVDSVTVHLGSGRRLAGRVGNHVGFDAYPLRSSLGAGFAGGVQIEPSGFTQKMACTQNHFLIEAELAGEEVVARHIVRTGTLAEYNQDPDFVQEMAEALPKDFSLYPLVEYKGHAWGMAIDLTACTGCNACVVACQSENNIPVVGKGQVLAGREMQWIRIDRYYRGGLENPSIVFQPMLCQHCENAPCEVVCPVAATTHSPEGINEMTYNRCVGTRYCSNNCPYKVRRFNFLLYQDWNTPTLKLLRNPDVSVRSRGVMEKCSYCVQRVNAAHIDSKVHDREIRDGDVVTACEAACPSQAIVFGDVNDPASRVARAKAEKLNYGALTDLNTNPRTSYLAKLTNPNPEIANE